MKKLALVLLMFLALLSVCSVAYATEIVFPDGVKIGDTIAEAEAKTSLTYEYTYTNYGDANYRYTYVYTTENQWLAGISNSYIEYHFYGNSISDSRLGEAIYVFPKFSTSSNASNSFVSVAESLYSKYGAGTFGYYYGVSGFPRTYKKTRTSEFPLKGEGYQRTKDFTVNQYLHIPTAYSCDEYNVMIELYHYTYTNGWDYHHKLILVYTLYTDEEVEDAREANRITGI